MDTAVLFKIFVSRTNATTQKCMHTTRHCNY